MLDMLGTFSKFIHVVCRCRLTRTWQRFSAAVFLLIAHIFVLTAHAQTQPYPNRAVKVVVPWPAGHTADTIGRMLAQRLQASFGQTFYVDNIAGAAGVIGLGQLARTPPDGNTILVTSGGPVVLAPLFLQNITYDPMKDFAAVAEIGSFGSMLVARPDFPANNLAELITYVRANPGKVTFSSTGMTSFNRLLMELLMRVSGLEMTHVPYKGEPESMTAVMGGTVDIGFAGASNSGPHVAAKRVKGIAVATPARSTLAPDIPTFKESGIPELQVFGEGPTQIPIGVFAPANTPAAVIHALNAEVGRLLVNPDFRRGLERQSINPATPTPPEAFRGEIGRNIAMWKKLIEEARITVE